MEEVIQKASILIEAIPYIHAFRKNSLLLNTAGAF